MATTFYYRLATDNDNNFLLWSGRATATTKTHASGVQAVRDILMVKKLPKNTLVVSEHELQSGNWSKQRIKEATLPTRKAPKSYAKPVADVPASFDDVQAMMKKFGLA